MAQTQLSAAQAMMAAAARPPRDTLRDRFNAFVRRHATAWEIAFAALAVAYVGLDLFFDNPDSATGEIVYAIEIGLTIIFAIEFFGRLLASRERSAHLQSHWIDGIALVPPVRALRVLRLVRVVRVLSGAYRASMGITPLAKHRGFISLVVTWLGLGALCTVAVYAAERDVNPLIHGPLDAIWWGVGALTTVGSDAFPVTLEGRLAAMLLMLVGVFVLAAIIATMTKVLIGEKPSHANERGSFGFEMERLVRLRDRGELTPEEFAMAKAWELGIATAPVGAVVA